MLDLKPKRVISYADRNNWDHYAFDLGKWTHVNKYITTMLRKWIETLDNPLALYWVQALLQTDLNKVEEKLTLLEEQLGEDNLFKIIEELGNEGGKANAILRKIESIQDEIHTFHLLHKLGHKDIRKIIRLGDWETKTSIISVKSILDLDLNYNIIEQIIRGQHFIKENFVLRQYNNIFLFNMERADDIFLKNIYSFLQQSFINSLTFLDNEHASSDYIHVNYYNPITTTSNEYLGRMEVEVRKLQEDEIVYHFQDKRFDDTQTRQIKFMLKKMNGNSQKHFYIHYDTNTFFKSNIDLAWINNRVKYYLKKIDQSYQKYSGKKEYVGWINLSIAPKHESHVINHFEDIKDEISSKNFGHPYRIIMSLNPQWNFNLNEPYLFEI